MYRHFTLLSKEKLSSGDNPVYRFVFAPPLGETVSNLFPGEHFSFQVLCRIDVSVFSRVLWWPT